MSRTESGRPTEKGVEHGRPYWLWLPESAPPWPGMVIVHGAGSRKENHGDFGRACAAAGWAAVAYDQRGHGESEDEMGPEAVADAARMARFLAGRQGVDPARVCVRGSSLGGWVAIHAAASSSAVAAALAICPAGEDHLRRGLRAGRYEFTAGAEAVANLDAWLSEHDLRDAVERLGTKPLLIVHARGDEQIPYQWSEELHRHALEPRKLILLPGGHHRSAQHDPELHGLALRWLDRCLAG
jgi:dienelactone hydrolase